MSSSRSSSSSICISVLLPSQPLFLLLSLSSSQIRVYLLSFPLSLLPFLPPLSLPLSFCSTYCSGLLSHLQAPLSRSRIVNSLSYSLSSFSHRLCPLLLCVASRRASTSIIRRTSDVRVSASASECIYQGSIVAGYFCTCSDRVVSLAVTIALSNVTGLTDGTGCASSHSPYRRNKSRSLLAERERAAERIWVN